MSVYLSPVGGAADQYFTNQGVVLQLGTVETYEAGTVVPIATYIDNTQTTQNGTVIDLDSAGRPPNEVWLLGGQSYKFIFKDADGVQVGPTWDNIAGINDPANGSGGGDGGGGGSLAAWEVVPDTPTYINSTSFSIPGNLTTTFPVGTRVKSTVTAGTVYGTVSASVFSTFTTVTLVNDGSTLDAGLSVVATSVNTVTGPNVGASAVRYTSGITNAAGSVGADLAAKDVVAATTTTNLNAVSKGTSTGGILTAYTLTPVPAIASYVDGQTWLAIAHVASGAAPTINISAQGVKNLKQYNSAGTKIAAVLTADATYMLAYDGTDVVIMNPTVPGGASGSLKRITRFIASGTWTKQADAPTVLVKVVGGGAGGTVSNGGGGAGGYAEAFVSSPGATETVTIGAGGAAGPSSGGTTSFGTWAVAGGAISMTGGIGTTGDIILRGGSGGRDSTGSGSGGNSVFGGGGGDDQASTTGQAGAANTGGGGGCGSTTGGVGGSGIVIVYEYG